LITISRKDDSGLFPARKQAADERTTAVGEKKTVASVISIYSEDPGNIETAKELSMRQTEVTTQAGPNGR